MSQFWAAVHWTVEGGTFAIASNILIQTTANVAAVDFGVMVMSSAVGTNDYYVQAKLTKGTVANTNVGIVGRYTISGTGNFYCALVRFTPTEIQLFKATGPNVFTQLGGNVVEAWTDGDTLRMEMTGSTISVYHCVPGCTLKISVTDSTNTTGPAGVRLPLANGTNGGSADDFEVGTGTVGTASIRHRVVSQ